MKPVNFPLSPVTRACAATALFGALATFGPQAFAATAAGTEIKNLATVTYEDAAGNSYSAQSNEAIVTVAQVYFATVGSDIDVTAAAGQTVYLPYVLTNTGNGTDIFTVAAVNDNADVDTLDATDIKVYRDTNGNGQPDSGEPELTSLSLVAGEATDIVVAVQIPTTAVDADSVGVTLTATAQGGNIVTDLSSGGGKDTSNGTVESTITVTDEAVLVMTKTSSHDVANNQITYTVTVTNNGNTSAKNVVLFDGLPAGTSYTSGGATPTPAPSVSGLLGTNGDTTVAYVASLAESAGFDFNGDQDTADGSEAAIGIDLNTDGVLDAASVPAGFLAKDVELAPNATVSMTFTVDYDPVVFGGGNSINNIAHASADLDDDGLIDAGFESSNRTSDAVTQSFLVSISDTGEGSDALPPAAQTNDGGDDEGAAGASTPNNIQKVSTAASGGTVLFDLDITNQGNGEDSFELLANLGGFPPGTIFTFYDETNSVQLTDTNGVGGVDTGPLQGTNDADPTTRTRRIVVRAKLPQDAEEAAPVTASVSATSAVDPSATPVTNSVSLEIGEIVAASADIHAAEEGTIGVDENPLGVSPYAPALTHVADAGATVNVPVFIDNEGGVSDSFQLFAGSSVDDVTGDLGALPDGWSVQFFLDDGAGNPTGPAISSTPTIPGGTVNFKLVAVVSVPADAALAEADVLFDANNDGTATSMDTNDGDGDYPLFLRILSANSGATDTVLEAIDVNAGREVTFTPSSSNQVEPGGTVDYPLTLSNTGNFEETLALTTTNSRDGFNNTVSIAIVGEATPRVLGNLVDGETISVLPEGGGAPVDILVSVTGGIPALTLPAGVDIPLVATVFAPATAPAGQVDTLTLVATNTDPAVDAPDATVSFQTDVINGQIRMTKTVAVDRNCDGDNLDTNVDPTLGDSAFAAVQTVEVEPLQCVIWRVVAENQGDVDARNVTVTDAATAFSAIEPGTLSSCLNATCDLDAAGSDRTDGVDADTANVTGSTVVFYVGTGATSSTGGVLVPGEIAKSQFAVRVE